MISDNKLHHMLGVARKCYELAIEKGYTENKARSLFLLGFIHDIGYEFSESGQNHEQIGHDIIYNTFNVNCPTILYHGQNIHDLDFIDLQILNIADLSINSQGYPCIVEDRLEDIKNRYGENSDQYINCKTLAIKLNLITIDSS